MTINCSTIIYAKYLALPYIIFSVPNNLNSRKIKTTDKNTTKKLVSNIQGVLWRKNTVNNQSLTDVSLVLFSRKVKGFEVWNGISLLLRQGIYFDDVFPLHDSFIIRMCFLTQIQVHKSVDSNFRYIKIVCINFMYLFFLDLVPCVFNLSILEGSVTQISCSLYDLL